jgi:N-acetylneuraminate synthase
VLFRSWYFGGSVKIHAFCDPRDIVFIRKYKINLCLDVSHFILSCNYFKLNKDIFFEKLNHRSKHYHISDGSSVDEEGKLLGNGDLLKTKILNKIFHDKNKIKVLETWQGHLNECLFFKDDLIFLKKNF